MHKQSAWYSQNEIKFWREDLRNIWKLTNACVTDAPVIWGRVVMGQRVGKSDCHEGIKTKKEEKGAFQILVSYFIKYTLSLAY